MAIFVCSKIQTRKSVSENLRKLKVQRTLGKYLKSCFTVCKLSPFK